MYVLTDLTPKEPALNARSTIRDTYHKQLNDRTMVCCIMLAPMNDEFSHHFKNTLPQDMLQMLNESFSTSDDVERYKTSYVIFNTRMREGTSITAHVLYIIKQIEHLSKLDFLLHKQLAKDAILNSLSKFYLPFLSHYRMTKPAVNYHGLFI